jgi:signal-transduction protein with cAMP-binding, CBS, and nucleotidyltransferase domain
LTQIQKQISDVLEGQPAARINIEDNVADALVEMKAKKSDCVLVFDGDDIKGIFTSRDFLHRVAAENQLPSETAIRDVMTSNPEQLQYSDCISYAIERMATCGFRNIPIATESEQLALLSVWDVMAHLSEVLSEVEESRQDDDDMLDELTDLGGG